MPDHPHGRGENNNERGREIRRYGPSPRAWGKRTNCCPGERSRRTIPTGVGKTYEKYTTLFTSTDHPHGRGENNGERSDNTCVHGPSPRAWGKRARNVRYSRTLRTIPTGVGKTSIRSSRSITAADHPHGRGENIDYSFFLRHYSGPSPRAWGKHEQSRAVPEDGRTIPTGVGKTVFERDSF